MQVPRSSCQSTCEVEDEFDNKRKLTLDVFNVNSNTRICIEC
jgi:hypothetical protein